MGTRGLLAAAVGVALAAIVAAPLAPGLYLAFAAVCHQEPARCFEWLGRPLPVCARCCGLYAGALAAAVWPVRAPAAALWLMAGVNAADWLFSMAGNTARFWLAWLFFWCAASALLAVARRERALGH